MRYLITFGSADHVKLNFNYDEESKTPAVHFRSAEIEIYQNLKRP